MPQVPQYNPQVQPAGLPSVRVNTEAPLEALGGGQSQQQVTDAITRVTKAASDLFLQEQEKADQVAHLAADNQNSELETQVQMEVREMRGKDALRAPEHAEKRWREGTEKIQEGLSNNAQRAAFQRSSGSRWQSLNKNVQMHVGEEIRKYDEQETETGISNSRNAAIVNSMDDTRIFQELNQQKVLLDSWAGRNGIPEGSPQYQEKLTRVMSMTHHDVIQTRINGGFDREADAYFKEHRGQMTAEDIFRAEKAVDDALAIRRGEEIYAKVQRFRLADGTADERRMEQYVMALDDLSMKDRARAWDYIKARANEDNVQKHKEDDARTHAFLNAVYTAHSKGVPMSEALKLVRRFSVDPWDVASKQNQVQQIYAPQKKEAHPDLVLNLWEAIESGDKSVTRESLDELRKSEQINVDEWRQLEKERFKKNVGKKDPLEKIEWDRVEKFARGHSSLTNKKDLNDFLYNLRLSVQGKDPSEYMTIANEKLKVASGSGYLWDFFGTKQNYKVEIQKRDERREKFREIQKRFYESVGETEGEAILKGLGKNWSVNDIRSFADRLGGYDELKPGRPVHNAIRSLIRRREPVNIENIKEILSKKPDGRW